MKVSIINILVIFAALEYSVAKQKDNADDRPRHNFDSVDITNSKNDEHLFSNKWVVHIDNGLEKAEELARKHGFHFHGQLGGLKDHYLFEKKDIQTRKRRSIEHHKPLSNEPNVRWLEQQRILKRTKRDFQDFTDPLFKDQWYLKNRGITSCKDTIGINVLPAWNRGITGKGVVVTILDDGLEYTHPDLKKNYEPAASYDFNDNDKDPFPKYTSDNINKHGTRCAGEVAADINNDVCGVGVAYNARVGGVRMLDGDVTDAVEGGSLSVNKQKIDIYSSSWGPDDDGKTVDGPGTLAKRAFKEGTQKGRNGKGSIFVWATGNGGRRRDYCSCDGYINSIYTISIGAVNDCGRSPWYAEPCPGTMAVTYSSGQNGINREIVTTDLHHKCTDKHTGTSAAAPLAAGVFALVLEANPKLTWRDLQHLVVHTSKKISPEDPEWQKNKANLDVNPKFGFGVLDTAALVEAASSEDWKTAAEQHVCKSKHKVVHKTIPAMGSASSKIYTSGCSGQSSSVNKLEHVHAYVTLKHPSRGGLIIKLKSPSGIVSPLLKRREHDVSNQGFTHWPFLTVFNWDEDPTGTWELTVTDTSGRAGELVEWNLDVYGTYDDSAYTHIDENKTCIDECVEGCPHAFSEKCLGCKQFCDCETGTCVSQCDKEAAVDSERRHCRRALEVVEHPPEDGDTVKSNNAVRDNNSIFQKQTSKTPSQKLSRPLLQISVPAKFAVIALSAAVFIALTAAIGYFLVGLPKKCESRQSVGYHPVARKPGTYVIDLDRSHDDGAQEEFTN